MKRPRTRQCGAGGAQPQTRNHYDNCKQYDNYDNNNSNNGNNTTGAEALETLSHAAMRCGGRSTPDCNDSREQNSDYNNNNANHHNNNNHKMIAVMTLYCRNDIILW